MDFIDASNSDGPDIKYSKVYRTKKDDSGNEIVLEAIVWKDGMPMRVRYGESEIYEPIVAKDYEPSKGKLIERIERCKDISGKEIYIYDGEIFGKSEFAKVMVYPADMKLFTFALEALPLSEKVVMEPRLYKVDGYLKLPESMYARRDASLQKILVDSIHVGSIDPDILRDGLSLLRKYPKQLTLFYALPGANIINALKLKDFPITINAIGSRDTGKSFAIDVQLILGYGYDIENVVLQDDAISSSYRHHATAGSTNLPLYIEEGKIKDKSMLKSFAKNLRGRPDQTLKVYGPEVSFVLSMNSDQQTADPIEREAEQKRILDFYFGDSDVVAQNERGTGEYFISKIKRLTGGMFYEKLKEKSIAQIETKYRELFVSENGDIKRVVALMGSWIYDDMNFKPVIESLPTPDILDEFYSWIIITSSKIPDIFYDPITREFKVPASVFADRFASKRGVKTSTSNFARSNGLGYNNRSWDGEERGKCIYGEIPKDKEDLLDLG